MRAEVIKGHDPQLERAIQWSLDQLAKNPPKHPRRPVYKVQPGLPEPSAKAGLTETSTTR